MGLSNLGHGSTGPNLEKFAVVIASSPNSPNSKLQTSLPRLDIFNSEQRSFYCYHSFAGEQANLSVFFPLRRKLSLFFFPKKSRIPEYLRGTIELASCNLGLYCLTLHRAAATRTAPLQLPRRTLFDTHSLSSHSIVFTASKPCHARLYLGMYIEQSYNPFLYHSEHLLDMIAAMSIRLPLAKKST